MSIYRKTHQSRLIKWKLTNKNEHDRILHKEGCVNSSWVLPCKNIEDPEHLSLLEIKYRKKTVDNLYGAQTIFEVARKDITAWLSTNKLIAVKEPMIVVGDSPTKNGV